MAQRIEPTTEQLQAAWQRRRRADWPASFDDTMAVPRLANLVRAEVVINRLALRRAEATAAAWAALRPYTTPAPRAPAAPPTVQPRLPLDRKRLAAGERDDD